MSILALRYSTLGAALITIIVSSLSVGPVYGVLAVAVPLVWLWFFCLRHGESRGTEPPFQFIWPIILSFAAACLIAPAVVAVAELLNGAFAWLASGNTLAYFAMRAGLVEELLKLSAVLLVVRYLTPGAIHHPRDGVIFACSAALGFSAYENLYHNLYLVQLESGVAQAFFLGAFVRVPLHALYACIWGAALGVSHFKSGVTAFCTVVLGLAPAVFLHGLWDTLAQSQGTTTGVLLTLFYGAFWYCYWRTWKRCDAVQLIAPDSGPEQI